MKAKVNRRLSAGFYHVNFQVGDFTTDEVQKMQSFGTPKIKMCYGGGPGQGLASAEVALNQVSTNWDAAFGTEKEAKDYEESVLNQIRDAIQRLRESQDKFSSSEEVAL